jgi:hypothetical protein
MIMTRAVDAYGLWYSFLLEAESMPGGHRVAGRIRSLEESNDPTGN